MGRPQQRLGLTQRGIGQEDLLHLLGHLRCRGPTGAVLVADPRWMQLESPLRALEPYGLEVRRKGGGRKPGTNVVV
jgi:hypothetical protein